MVVLKAHHTLIHFQLKLFDVQIISLFLVNIEKSLIGTKIKRSTKLFQDSGGWTMDWKFSENLAQNLPAFYEKQRYNLEWPSVSGCKPIVYGMTRNMNKNDLATFYNFNFCTSYF